MEKTNEQDRDREYLVVPVSEENAVRAALNKDSQTQLKARRSRDGLAIAFGPRNGETDALLGKVVDGIPLPSSYVTLNEAWFEVEPGEQPREPQKPTEPQPLQPQPQDSSVALQQARGESLQPPQPRPLTGPEPQSPTIARQAPESTTQPAEPHSPAKSHAPKR
jgi:hypothetical protein